MNRQTFNWCHATSTKIAANIAELPENSPRYVVLSYELKHSDGRTSFPLILINWAPTSSEIGMMTLHASALWEFQSAASFSHTYDNSKLNAWQADVSKVIEMREGAEGLTKEAIDKHLNAR